MIAKSALLSFMKNRIFKALPTLVGLVLCSTQSVYSASSEWISSGDNRLRLVFAEPQAGSETLNGMLEVDLAKGWKTYWKDPGDAGVPLQLDFSTSQNISDTVVHFPMPKRFDDGVTVWAGYDEPVSFPVTLLRPDTTKPATVNAKLFLGLCDKICVPFQTSFTVSVADAAVSTADQILVEAGFAMLPVASDSENGVSNIKVVDDHLEIATNLKNGAAQDLFLAAPAGWQFAAPVIAEAQGTNVKFKAEILFRPKATAVIPAKLDYTLRGLKQSVSGTAEF